jgi:hypothetical protein
LGPVWQGEDEVSVDFLVQKGVASSNTEKNVFSSCIGKSTGDILGHGVFPGSSSLKRGRT